MQYILSYPSKQSKRTERRILQSQRGSYTGAERQNTLMCSRTLIQFDLTVLRIGITKFITVDGFRIQHKVQLFWIL